MKIIATSDWHLGNLFHSNDRLLEHSHFIHWLLMQIEQQQPDALLVAGDVFDSGNPSAASQETYYKFLTDASDRCPSMRIVITAGNHDSGNRLEAPRALLNRHHIEVRGNVHRSWQPDDEGKGSWQINYDDLMIPIEGQAGDRAVVLAVPYLRSDIVQGTDYSQGVSSFLRELTRLARLRFPGLPLIMQAHMYATGAEIAKVDASERIIIGGMEEVNIEAWSDHPDYLTCGHIHKRQHIWNTDWARYTGSVLPMSFAEVDYQHGVDLITFDGSSRPKVQFLEYEPLHRLRIIPQDNEERTPNKLAKLIDQELTDRVNGQLGDDFDYVMLRVKLERVNNDDLHMLEEHVAAKNAVLCKFDKIHSSVDITTLSGEHELHSVEDILSRDPLETLQEAFAIKHNTPMSDHQQQMLRDIINTITSQSDEQ